ncbi:MAG: orotidine-5'-phosphate decarboxylase [Deltaproteobacteria bacterium]|nr:orotidine-5'-phosphate decarboxylase [Deltaproteobacteria bacterium]MBW2394120.1 orotidine-5'-phosphate decarboxylase [Deltaproteobacteria bacterium]
MAEPFADRLIHRTRALGHPLCVGFDPHLGLLPPLFRRGSMAPGDQETAEAVADFCLAMLDRVAGRVACIKPQSAFFEALGWRGIEVLDRVMRAARERDLLVILDAKRGDVGSTAEGYAAAYLSADAPLRADALTVNPYLGGDSLEPFLMAAEKSGAGLFVLVKTSNPGSGDLQDREAQGQPIHAHVAAQLAAAAPRLAGPATGWSGVGAVVGATYPEEARQARERMPSNLLLVPGFGAQGAGPDAAVAAFSAGPDGVLEGGVVNSSRGVLFPDAANLSDAKAWEREIDDALAAAITALAKAVAARP